jgi:hypothetical protein
MCLRHIWNSESTSFVQPSHQPNRRGWSASAWQGIPDSGYLISWVLKLKPGGALRTPTTRRLLTTRQRRSRLVRLVLTLRMSPWGETCPRPTKSPRASVARRATHGRSRMPINAMTCWRRRSSSRVRHRSPRNYLARLVGPHCGRKICWINAVLASPLGQVLRSVTAVR